MKLNQVVQFKYPEGDFYKLLQVYDLMGIEYKKVFPVTEAQDLQSTLILSAEMRAEVQAADLGAESQQLTTGHLDGSILKSEEEAAPGVALVTFKMIGFVKYVHIGSKNNPYLELFQVEELFNSYEPDLTGFPNLRGL